MVGLNYQLRTILSNQNWWEKKYFQNIAETKVCSVESEKKEEKGRLFLFPMSGLLFQRKKEREREEKEKT